MESWLVILQQSGEPDNIFGGWLGGVAWILFLSVLAMILLIVFFQKRNKR